MQQIIEVLSTHTNTIAIVGIALAVAYLTAEALARLFRSAVRTIEGESPSDLTSPIVRRPIRLVRLVVFALAGLALVRIALQLAGATDSLGVDLDRLSRWFFESGLRIGVVVILAFVLVRLVAVGVARFERTIEQRAGPTAGLEAAKRARTLGRLINSALVTLVLVVSGLMILRELGLDITPVLASAGLASLAIGFGAQTLVKDVISGFFLILEDHVRIGDVANINGTAGVVEATNLRTTVLRDLSGTVHVFPNGSVTSLSNLTKDFSYYVADIGVAYKEDTDRVVEVLTTVGQELTEDPAYASDILAPLEILGVDAFGASEVVIKIRIRTLPTKQWRVGRELRRRIKKAFDAQGIEIPFPHVSLYVGAESKPLEIRQTAERSGSARE